MSAGRLNRSPPISTGRFPNWRKKIAACAEFDAKIAAVQEKAAKLAERKKEVLSPKKRKPRKSKAERIRELVKQAQKSGMKLDEIAEKLGMPLSE